MRNRNSMESQMLDQGSNNNKAEFKSIKKEMTMKATNVVGKQEKRMEQSFIVMFISCL